MFYIKSTPDEFGNCGNPTSNYVDGMVALPIELIQTYCDSFGFVNLTIEGETVTAVTKNEEAYQVYIDSVPEPTPPEPTEEDDMNAMLVDHEYRLTLVELGLN